ncbi:hypothetical protein Pcinc_043274 [Petrolisthes cinctipes]|uniref:Uncharacterized protein n=1 Tax=Petrolisthes cinctipes TaxID=88211 RepID=A0AAE1BG50_PETCI|nr:hypothetical protein Pcinc_043274 [Petrolisthes cinctipes]
MGGRLKDRQKVERHTKWVGGERFRCERYETEKNRERVKLDEVREKKDGNHTLLGDTYEFNLFTHLNPSSHIHSHTLHAEVRLDCCWYTGSLALTRRNVPKPTNNPFNVDNLHKWLIHTDNISNNNKTALYLHHQINEYP